MTGVSAESYPVIDAGVDWITATGDKGLTSWKFWGVGDSILQTQTAAGVEVKPAAVRDYRGRRGDGIFLGRRNSDTIIILSGPRADEHFAEVTRAASNVSRLDVQMTLYTASDSPHLARDMYSHLKAAPARRGKPPRLTYTESHPRGETFNYGSRSSDSFGRLYDKASEAKLGPPRSIWRAEVEFKRGVARGVARRLSELPMPRPAMESVVSSWWVSRGLRLPVSLAGHVPIELRPADRAEVDELGWLARMTPRAIRCAIARHGIQSVVDALGLSDHVEVKYASRTRHRD